MDDCCCSATIARIEQGALSELEQALVGLAIVDAQAAAQIRVRPVEGVDESDGVHSHPHQQLSQLPLAPTQLLTTHYLVLSKIIVSYIQGGRFFL